MTLTLLANVKLAAEDLYISEIRMLTPDNNLIKLSWSHCRKTWEHIGTDLFVKYEFADLMLNGKPATGHIDMIKTLILSGIDFHTDIDNVADFYIDVTKLIFKDKNASYEKSDESLYHYPET